MLTTFFVNSLVDDASGTVDGMISLREATIAANTNEAFGDAPAGDANGDRIRFDSSVNGMTSMLTFGQIEITDDVLIQGGGTDLTIDAVGNSGIFVVNSSETVGLGGLSLTGGLADIGGAIYSTGGGTTLLNNMSFLNNIATGQGGGAIYLETGSLFASDSTFVGNQATGDSGSGGALFQQSGNVGIFNGSMLANVANRAGGAIEIVDGSFYSANLQVGAEGQGNIAGPKGTAAPGNGGGMHVTGTANIVVNGGHYTDNHAAREGGGLWNQAGSSMFVTNTSITNNSAAGNDADDGGGGIFNNGGELFITGANITGNTATGTSGSGGGIFSTGGNISIRSTLIDSNIANRAGGGIEIVNGSLTFTDSTLGGKTGNVAGPAETAAPGNGGGLHVTGDNASVVIRTSSVSGNFAASEGGGLWNQAGSVMHVLASEVAFNTANGDAADNGGGGIFNNGGSITIIGSTVSGNHATGASGSGGGIFSTGGDITISNSVIESNVANRAGGGIEIVNGRLDLNSSTLGGEFGADGNIAGPDGTAAPGNGGGLHVTGMESQVYVRNSLIANNVAASEGGGLWNQAGSLLRVDNSTVEANFANGGAADNGGGGIFNNGGRLTMVNTDVLSNFADGMSGSGGGIFSTDGPVLVFSSTIDGNAAARAGGGIEIVNGFMRFTDSTISNNDAGITFTAAPGNGGGLHVSGDAARVVIRGTLVDGNLAASEGGGLWNQAGSFMRVDSESLVTFNDAQGNDADNGGGGIFNNGGRITISQATITGNRAIGEAGSGGGIFSTDGTVLAFNTDIDGNSAIRAGGGIEVINGYMRITFTRVINNEVTMDANPGNGGGLHVSGNDCRFVLVDSEFSGNIAQNQGGGLWNQTDSQIRFLGNNVINNNTAVDGVGGGVYSRGHLHVVDSAFEENESGFNGGGIFLTETGSASIFDSDFVNNISAGSGGGIFNDNLLNVENSNFTDNIATINGGGIFTADMATTNSLNNTFSGNVPNDQN